MLPSLLLCCLWVQVHAMDFTCAAATAVFDPFLLKWSDLVIKMLQLPRHVFPRVLPTAYDYGSTEESLFGASIPICCLVLRHFLFSLFAGKFLR